MRKWGQTTFAQKNKGERAYDNTRDNKLFR